MKKIFIILFLLLSYPTLLLANLDNAEINNVFLVENISVGRVDEDATKAREKAILKAQRDAFNSVLERMDMDSSNGILVSDVDIGRVLKSMKIRSERITSNSYSAKISLEFNPEYFNFILNKYRITRYSPKFNSYLILPVIEKDGEFFIWDEDNLWIKAFSKKVKDYGNILLLEDDYMTNSSIDLDDLKSLKFKDFTELLDIYNVNNIVIVLSEYKDKDINTEVNTETQEDKTLEKEELEQAINSQIYVINEEKMISATLSYKVEDNKNISSGYSGSADEIIIYINSLSDINEDKNSFNIEEDEDGYINIYAPISSIKDFLTIRNNLSTNINIEEINLKMVSKELALFSVKYNDEIDLETLKISLEDSGFDVNEKNKSLYVFYNDI